MNVGLPDRGPVYVWPPKFVVGFPLQANRARVFLLLTARDAQLWEELA